MQGPTLPYLPYYYATPLHTSPVKEKFIDVGLESCIEFRHFNGASGRRYLVETMGSGAAFFDYDSDGNLDVYIVNGSDLPGIKSETPPADVLYRNNGDGQFTDTTQISRLGNAAYGMGCAVGDYDNDGFPDFYATNFGPNALYKNNGDGTFSDITKHAKVGCPDWSSSAAFIDYDSDGDLDLYVVNYLDYRLEENKLCGLPEIPTYCGPLYYDGSADILYRNDGDGTFSDVSRQVGIHNPQGKGLGVVCGDYNSDGYADIFVANDTSPNSLYKNNGDGTFSDMALFAGVAYSEDGSALAGMGVDFGDYDNDGDLDIFVTNFSYEHNSLFRNLGDGSFKNMTHEAGIGEASFAPLGFGTGFLDYDNDGWLDIFVANGHILDNVSMFSDSLTYAQNPQLFHNRGDSVYLEVSEEAGGYFTMPKVSRGAAFGDYDNDGDLDILVVNLNDKPDLLRNEAGNANHWLLIQTVGTISNRDGIGTQVKLFSKSGMQTKEVKTAYSYLSSNDPRLIFGLGSDSKVDLLQILWPGGSVQELKDIEANQMIKVVEGKYESYLFFLKF